MYYKPTKFDENLWSHFSENENFFIFFLCELPLILSLSLFASFLCNLSLILRVGRKLKTLAGDISKGTLDIKFEQD